MVTRKKILVLAGMIFLSLSVFAQSVSMKMDNVSVKKAIDEFKARSGYSFVYVAGDIDTQKTVSINASTLTEAVEQIISGQNLDYAVKGKSVVISKKAAAAVSSEKMNVRGKVITETGEPAIGLFILEKGTKNGAATDFEGGFTIRAAGNSTLVISGLGYQETEVPVNGRSLINATVKEDITQLNETVVIGYGSSRKKDLTGAISQVKSDDVIAALPRSVGDMLLGAVAGVDIGAATDARGNTSIKIRSDVTLDSGSQPLIVVDGAIYNATIADINPDDIATIDVLKDAAACSIYGSKAANGILMITTKRGTHTKDGRPTLNFSSTLGMATMMHAEQYQGEEYLDYRTRYWEDKKASNLDKHQAYYRNPLNLETPEDQLAWYKATQKKATAVPDDHTLVDEWLTRLNLTSSERECYFDGIVTDWADEVFQKGFIQNYTLSASQATDWLSQYYSLNYVDRESGYRGDRYQTTRAKVNVESKINNFIKIGINAQFAARRDDNGKPDKWKNYIYLSPYSINYIGDPNASEKQKFYPNGTEKSNLKNPFYEFEHYTHEDMVYSLVAHAYGIITLPFGFEYEIDYDPYYSFGQNNKFKTKQNLDVGTPKAQRTTHQNIDMEFNNTLRWEKAFNDVHKIQAMANVSRTRSGYIQDDSYSTNPDQEMGYYNMILGTEWSAYSKYLYESTDAIAARIHYSFKERYMLQASVRRDGYSGFGANYKHAIFPAVSAAWVFSQENFMKKASWLDYGKLRLSYGKNGNIGSSQYDAIAQMYPYIYKRAYANMSGSTYDENAAMIISMANDELRWEAQTAANIGLDFSLFNERLGGAIEMFTSESTDLLLDMSVPSVTGFDETKINRGRLSNKGLEISLHGYPIKTKDVTWKLSGTFATYRHKILSLYGFMEDVYDEAGNVIGQREKDDDDNGYYIGHDPDQYFGVLYDGIWQEEEAELAAKYDCQPGDRKAVDLNGDFKINDDDRVWKKWGTRKANISLGSDFRWKNWTVGARMAGKLGRYNTISDFGNNDYSDKYNYIKIPYWTPENRSNKYARVRSDGDADYYCNSSYFRMSNLNVTYSVPSKVCDALRMRSMSLTAEATNLFVIAPWWPKHYWDVQSKSVMPRDFTMTLNITF